MGGLLSCVGQLGKFFGADFEHCCVTSADVTYNYFLIGCALESLPADRSNLNVVEPTR